MTFDHDLVPADPSESPDSISEQSARTVASGALVPVAKVPLWRRVYVWVIFVTLLAGWPLAALLSASGNFQQLASYVASARVSVYINTGLMLWLMFFLIWSAQRAGRTPFRDIGFAAPRMSDPLIALGFLIGANLILNVLAWALKSAGMAVPQEAVLALLPVSAIEKILWVLLSISAGICEESCFRGFLLTQGSRFTRRLWLVVLASSLAFGVGHLYQGIAGAMLIVVYGLMFCWLRLRRQSLWPGIWAHIWQDLAAMALGQWTGY